MKVLSIILLVAFVIVSVLLILMVLIQDEDDNGMGGLLSSSTNAAFGSRSANVLTKTTRVLVILFFVLAFGLAFVFKGNASDKELKDETAVEQAADAAPEADTSWFEEAPAAAN